MSGELAASVIGDIDATRIAWLDGVFRISRYRTPARGKSLIDYKRGIANIGKQEGTMLFRILLGERAKVVAKGVELDFGLLLGSSSKCHRFRCHYRALLHGDA